MTYTDYPFTANGVNFISRIAEHSPNLRTIANLPDGVFVQMNIEAVTNLIGDVSLLTRDELIAELDRVNEGASHSWILLGDNN